MSGCPSGGDEWCAKHGRAPASPRAITRRPIRPWPATFSADQALFNGPCWNRSWTGANRPLGPDRLIDRAFQNLESVGMALEAWLRPQLGGDAARLLLGG